MPNLQGQTIGRGKCASCGGPVILKTNKNGIAYYYCAWSRPDGQPCSHHQKWGRADSAAMCATFLKSKGKTDGETRPQDHTDTDRPDAGSGHFLFG